MSEQQPTERQDPREPHEVDQVVETHTASESGQPAQPETKVETTVTESASDE